jgi:putative tricarboxylic transport membrane protein
MNARRFSLILIAVCVVAIMQVFAIPESPMYAVVGATFVPAAVVGLFAVCAVIYIISAFRGAAPDAALDNADEKPLEGAIRRFAWFSGGCAAMALLVQPLGFLLAGTVAATGIARAFDASLGLRTLLICSAITLSFWLLFDPILNVDLGPVIPLSRWLSAG